MVLGGARFVMSEVPLYARLANARECPHPPLPRLAFPMLPAHALGQLHTSHCTPPPLNPKPWTLNLESFNPKPQTPIQLLLAGLG